MPAETTGLFREGTAGSDFLTCQGFQPLSVNGIDKPRPRFDVNIKCRASIPLK